MSTNQDIELACKSFQNAVQKRVDELAKRRKRKHHDINLDKWITTCNRCTKHGNHVLKTLHAKRSSLRNALEAFEQATDDCIRLIQSARTTNTDGKQLQRDVLRHWFGNFLRLRDGFVLLESGERRHPGDDDNPLCTSLERKQFASRLSRGGFRADGKTRTFSSEKGYTGTGWDEMFDGDVGIKKRLTVALAQIDGRDGQGEKIWDKILDSGGALWDVAMECHNTENRELRGKLRSIRERFEEKVNEYLATARNKDKSIPSKLVLVTDDKAERITMGLCDIRREGNAFILDDEGGSLPIGMTKKEWLERFAFQDSVSEKNQAEGRSLGRKSLSDESRNASKLKKRRILEDSDDDDEVAVAPKKSEAKASFNAKSSSNPIKNNDGLLVTVRDTAGSNNGISESVNEMKRAHGVSTLQLEEGLDSLNKEQQQSSMVAEEEELLDGFLGDDVFRTANGGPGSLNGMDVKHLQQCVRQWIDLRKKLALQSSESILDDGEVHELWSDLRKLLKDWKDSLKELVSLRIDILKGHMENASDDAYKIRENAREANMLLGNEFLEVSRLLSTEYNLRRQKSNSPIIASLSRTASFFLRAAEEVFGAALGLVAELELTEVNSIQPASNSIERHWIKGQHLLLRGRAQTNIGLAVMEQVSGGNITPSKQIMSKSLKYFSEALGSANELHNNSRVISIHANANSISTNDRSRTWTSEASRHSLEAVELRAFVSRHLGKCLWKLNRTAEAKNALLDAIELSGVLQLLTFAAISPADVLSPLHEGYWSAMTLAILATRSMESIPFSKFETSKGDQLIFVMSEAMDRASQISDKFFSVVAKYSLDESMKEYSIATRNEIKEEETNIKDLWKSRKEESQKTISTGSKPPSNLPRRDLASNLPIHGNLPPHTRRIFIRDASATSGRSRKQKKQADAERRRQEARSATESFHTEFCSPEEGAQNTVESRGAGKQNPKIEYRKWGDEILDDNDKKMHVGCCPPLPPDMPPNLRKNYEAKYAAILPKTTDAEVAAFYAPMKFD